MKIHERAIMTEDDWTEWLDKVNTPDYRPKQFTEGYLSTFSKLLNIHTRRSPLGMTFPCCIAPCLISCISTSESLSIPKLLCNCGNGDKIDVVNLLDESQASSFFENMLANENPSTPEALKGVWWLKDNIAHERFVTLSDTDWVHPRLGFKSLKTNWTRDKKTLLKKSLS